MDDSAPARTPSAPPSDRWNWYGTTIRVYDPTIEAAHLLDRSREQFVPPADRRAQGADIVQEGKTETGVLTRWRFTTITANSFHCG